MIICVVFRVDGVLCPGSGLLSLLRPVGGAPGETLQPWVHRRDTARLECRRRVATIARFAHAYVLER